MRAQKVLTEDCFLPHPVLPSLTPPTGIQPKWVMNWQTLMWVVNPSSPTLQSLLVNIYKSWGILSCLRRSICISTNTGEEKREDIVKVCKDIRSWRALWRLEMVKELVIYKRKSVTLMNTFHESLILFYVMHFESQSPETRWLQNIQFSCSFNTVVKSINPSNSKEK